MWSGVYQCTPAPRSGSGKVRPAGKTDACTSSGRPDVLPVDDYSLRKAYAKAFNKRKLPTPQALEKLGEKWRPYRTVASWYLWSTLNTK